MNRVEQLTYDLLDDRLDEVGLGELERLIAEDPAARSLHLALCEQEALLRGHLSVSDVRGQAMARIHQQLGGSHSTKAAWETPGRIPPPPPPGSPSAGPPEEQRAWGPGGSVPLPGRSPSGAVSGPLAGSIPPPPPPQGDAAPPPGVPASPPVSPPGMPTSPTTSPPSVGPLWSFASESNVPPSPQPPAPPTRDKVAVSPPAPPVWAPGDEAPVAPVDGVAVPVGPPPAERPPVAAVAAALGPIGAMDEEAGEPEGWIASWTSSRTLMASLSSMLFHMSVMILLALWVVPSLSGGPPRFELLMMTDLAEAQDPDMERPFETIFLDERLDPATASAAWESNLLGPEWAADVAAELGPAKLEESIPVADLLDLEKLRERAMEDSVSGQMVPNVAPGAAGLARVVVDDYEQALDRITQELARLLEKDELVVVWCFDQSESMKDDQEEIRDRVNKVYAELGLTGSLENDALTTAVTSFGKDFRIHTPIPTSDLENIRAAIDAVPVDPSGEEMMCRAVNMSIGSFRQYAHKMRRQMALILVSDESGNSQENERYTEATIAHALGAKCKVYVLGREAVFGYPTAHIRWVHPQTNRVHWLPVDRGPETAFVEQLQTDGFDERTDAHPSGYGPYFQSRLAWRTGGMFFLLPSLESNLVQGQKRRYKLDAMEDYHPDVRSPVEILMDIQRSPLRSLLVKIVNDMNPYKSESAKRMEIRDRFAADKEEFVKQAMEAEKRAGRYLDGLERAVEAVEARQAARDDERSKRWQANYDLMHAQLVAYSARVRAYLAALEEARRKASHTPDKLASNAELVGWNLRQRKGVAVDDATKQLLQRSQKLYLEVIENHPGTPWAARAEWELARDFQYPGRLEPETAPAGEGAARPDETAPADVDPDTAVARVGPAAKAVAGAAAGTDVGVDVAVGVGGGGGGGGGVGVGVGVDVAAGGGAAWGVDEYPAFELVPDYRKPKPPKKAGGSKKPRKPRPNRPQPPRVPIPKL